MLRRSAPVVCDACGASIEGEVGGRGRLLFVRGDALEAEEPPLCHACALAIGITAIERTMSEEDDG